ARHVREGEERLGRQQALIDRLALAGPSDLLTKARDIFAQMLQFQVTAIEHYQRELVKQQKAI
ncbi:MAG: hypothetical protein JOZ42_07280, partial [Acetobacteraceae bacterium]|nr:hypothetical protein [Acetobacteraceae bacterium]